MNAPPLVSIPVISEEQYLAHKKKNKAPYLILLIIILGAIYIYSTSSSDTTETELLINEKMNINSKLKKNDIK